MLRLHFALLCFLVGAAAKAQTSSPSDAYRNTGLSAEERAHDLVRRMTLEEKVSQMMNDAPGIPRLGIAPYNWWSEGLHGVARSGYATTFPQAIGMAATWDPGLMLKVGTAISVEARAKYQEALRHDNHAIFYGLTIWSPNINILRDPRWGRGQETYGEDPFLTASLAVPFIRGLQGDDPRYYRTIATPKHFAVHSGPESDRHRENVKPSPHDLWDTYLPAFRAAITEGKADSLMCAYNSLNDEPACANRFLLQKTLREDWGFRGFVTSDCGAVDDFFKSDGHRTSVDAYHAAAAALEAGTDTNCGTTYNSLRQAVRGGLVSEEKLDISLIRLFAARIRLGMFDNDNQVPYAAISFSEVGSSAHSALALRAARESLVLLKNRDNLLPLDPKQLHRIAIIGPNATSLSSLEGNYNAIPRSPVSPLDGIHEAFPRSEVFYAQGASFAEGIALPVPRTVFHPDTTSREQGLMAEYFASEDLEGKPTLKRLDPQLDFDWTAAAPVAGLAADHFSVRWSGTITSPQAGTIEFSVGFPECYPCSDRERFRIFLDNRLIVASEPERASVEREPETPRFRMTFPDTKSHALRIEYRHQSPLFGAGFRLDWVPPASTLLAEALSAAGKSDVIIAVVGLSPLLEGEEMPIHVPGFAGGDKLDLELPEPQEHLLEELGKTGKPLIVVLLNGSALGVRWAKEHAAAILEAWYPGESGGTAIGETLNGVNNPSGRLPMTFYKSVNDLPSFSDYSMANRTYRYYKGEPLYPFGFGLSYTQFRYGRPRPSTARLQAGQSLTVDVEVNNTGIREGDEVAELYLAPPSSALAPQLALAGIEHLHLVKGETRLVHFTLDARTLSTADAEGNRAVEPGSYRIFVGGTQPRGRDEDASMPIEIVGRFPVER